MEHLMNKLVFIILKISISIYTSRKIIPMNNYHQDVLVYQRMRAKVNLVSETNKNHNNLKINRNINIKENKFVKNKIKRE